MFKPRLFGASPEHERIYGLYERVYTVIDVVAAWCFVVGSVMFFSEAWVYPGTWLFLLGSFCFAAKPTVRFMREYHLATLPLPGDDPAAGDTS
ncbi:MAG: YrhK family protein [Pseudomonadota bacterium]